MNFKLDELLVDEDGRLAYVSKIDKQWCPVFGKYIPDQLFISDAHGGGFSDLSRYKTTGYTFTDIRDRLASALPKYQYILGLGLGLDVQWLAFSWEHIQSLISGNSLSCTFDTTENLHESEVLLYAVLSECEFDLDLAIAWIRIRRWNITKAQALRLFKDPRFWANKWSGNRSNMEGILRLSGLEFALVWNPDFIESQLASPLASPL
jgi:hypothetical protein